MSSGAELVSKTDDAGSTPATVANHGAWDARVLDHIRAFLDALVEDSGLKAQYKQEALHLVQVLFYRT